MKSTYIAADTDSCLAKGHRFELFGSEKHPKKKHLTCVTCSLVCGQTVMVAYADFDEKKSWGVWKEQRREEIV